jgi:hypothetical protein
MLALLVQEFIVPVFASAESLYLHDGLFLFRAGAILLSIQVTALLIYSMPRWHNDLAIVLVPMIFTLFLMWIGSLGGTIKLCAWVNENRWIAKLRLCGYLFPECD